MLVIADVFSTPGLAFFGLARAVSRAAPPFRPRAGRKGGRRRSAGGHLGTMAGCDDAGCGRTAGRVQSAVANQPACRCREVT